MGRTAAAARQEKPNCRHLESATATAAVMSAHLPHDDAQHITKGAVREKEHQRDPFLSKKKSQRSGRREKGNSGE